MYDSIIKQLNLKPVEVETIESITTDSNDVFILTLKRKDHVCPYCSSITHSIKDYKLRFLKQKIFYRSIASIYYKVRRYYCKQCGKTFIEKNSFINSKKRIPPATIFDILNDLKPYNSTFSSVARIHNLSVSSVIDIFDKHVQIKRKTLTSILCWDEFYFNRYSKYKYAFMMMDFNKKIILDIVESKQMKVLDDYFFKIKKEERLNVQYIVIDMYKNYRILAQTYFPWATLIVDPFHVVKKVNDALNSLRKTILRKYKNQQESLEYKLLKYRYQVLFKCRGDLECTDRKYDRIFRYSITERALVDFILDIDPLLKEAYFLKERYLKFNQFDPATFSRETKNQELSSIIQDMMNSSNQMIECAKTLFNWREEILNSFIEVNHRRLSNGPIEGKNTYIKKIINNANGFNNFERARNKFLYSQNLFENFSASELKSSIKRKGHSRGPYKKKKS